MGFVDFWSVSVKILVSFGWFRWFLVGFGKNTSQLRLVSKPTKNQRNPPQFTSIFTKTDQKSTKPTWIDQYFLPKPTKNHRNPPQLTTIFTKTDQKSTKPTSIDQYFYRNRPKITETHLNWSLFSRNRPKINETNLNWLVFLPKPTINQRNPPQLTSIFTETDQKSPKPTSIDHYFHRNRQKITETHLNWPLFLPKPTKNQRNPPQLTSIFTKPTKNQRNPPQLTSIFTKTDQKSTKPTWIDQYFLPKPTKNHRNPPQLTTIFTKTDQKSTKPTSIDQYFYRNRPKITETHLNWSLFSPKPTKNQRNPPELTSIFYRNRPKITETHLNWPLFLRNRPKITETHQNWQLFFTKPTINQRNPPQLTSIFTETDKKSPKPTSIDHYFYQNRPKINETHLNWPVFLQKPTKNQRNPPKQTNIFTETDQKSTKPTSIDQYFLRNRPKINETHLNWPVFLPKPIDQYFYRNRQKITDTHLNWPLFLPKPTKNQRNPPQLTSIFTETDQKSPKPTSIDHYFHVDFWSVSVKILVNWFW